MLFAESLGIGSTWIAGTMDRKAFERAMSLSEGEVMPCVSTLGYPARKMSLKETMMRKGIKADTRLDFNELFFSCKPESLENKGILTPVDEEGAGRLNEPLDLVRWAPSAAIITAAEYN